MALMLACFGARNLIGAGHIQTFNIDDKPEPVTVNPKHELVWTGDGFGYR